MDELEGRRLKAAILQEEVSDDVWERLIPYADGLLKAIKAFFYQYTHIHDHTDSEDVLNASFAKVVINIDKYSPELPLLPWIKRIAHNEVVNVLRSRSEEVQLDFLKSKKNRRKAYQERAFDADVRPEAKGETSDLDTDATTDESLNLLSYVYDYGDDASKLAGTTKSKIFRQELELLSDKEQTLIIDHYSNGITLVDLANREGISQEAMRKRAERMRANLFDRLVRHPEFARLKQIKVARAPLRR
ncbi:MAG TPA: sigma-70 family RNA polymerase sigma factor [Pyrinomonadaceae bacterium]|nr:sigma-70 family RNA polymerase sigma factor [Pyrinomonadaceae bacterium]